MLDEWFEQREQMLMQVMEHLDAAIKSVEPYLHDPRNDVLFVRLKPTTLKEELVEAQACAASMLYALKGTQHTLTTGEDGHPEEPLFLLPG